MPGPPEILPASGEISNLCNTKTGLVLHTCPNIQALLSAASKSTSIAPALQNAAVQHLDAPVVPYPIVRDLWVQLTPAYGVPFHQVLAGSSFVLEAPKPREKSKELKERLAKLQEVAEQKAYKELVKDITKHEGDEDREYFSSYKNSLGFGIHVVAIMFTGYMFGYAIFRAQFQNSPSMHAAGGVLGLIAGMFVETILFIVRASLEEKNTRVKLQTKEKLKPLPSTPSEVMVIPVAKPDTAASGVRQRRSHTEAPG